MSLGKRKRHRQAELWISTSEVPEVGGHPFYSKLEEILSSSGFDDECEKLASPYYSKLGKPGLPLCRTSQSRTVVVVAGKRVRRSRERRTEVGAEFEGQDRNVFIDFDQSSRNEALPTCSIREG